MGLISLASVLVLTIFSVQSLLRDKEHRMFEIVLATPVRKLHYLGARFCAMLLACSSAGNSNAASTAMMAMTTSNSMRVKPTARLCISASNVGEMTG